MLLFATLNSNQLTSVTTALPNWKEALLASKGSEAKPRAHRAECYPVLYVFPLAQLVQYWEMSNYNLMR